jgi:hypothetical protein
MKKYVDIDILKGCAEIIKNYFTVQEFSGSKVNGYEKALYNALQKAINKGNKNEQSE